MERDATLGGAHESLEVSLFEAVGEVLEILDHLNSIEAYIGRRRDGSNEEGTRRGEREGKRGRRRDERGIPLARLDHGLRERSPRTR